MLRWDQNAERAIGPNRDGQSADEINGGIMRLARNLAQRLGKTETEVSRWLSGTHNLTLSTICKISTALGEDIVTVPKMVLEPDMA